MEHSLVRTKKIQCCESLAPRVHSHLSTMEIDPSNSDCKIWNGTGVFSEWYYLNVAIAWKTWKGGEASYQLPPIQISKRLLGAGRKCWSEQLREMWLCQSECPFCLFIFFPTKYWISRLKVLLSSLPACSHIQKYLHQFRTVVFTVQ